MFFQSFGIWQILLILLVILILFGVGKLPEVGRGLGKAINEFRTNVKDDDKKESDSNTDKSTTESKTETDKAKK
jgi:sec-independent protein translocase protein TatA